MPKLKRAIAYVRVSKEREGMISPELQEKSVRDFAAREGFTVVDVVADLDLSGTTFNKRSVGSIIDRVRAGEAEAVIVWKWSRWGRNTEESLSHIKAVEAVGGQVRSATEDADETTSAGFLMRGMNLLLADVESRQKSEGWKQVQARRRDRGQPHSGAPRFGYTKDDAGNFVPDPVTGPALAEAYERYAAGVPLQRIVIDLNKRGIVSTRGNPIRANSLLATMDGGFAAGLMRSRSTGKARNSATKPGPFDTWTKGTHEALIIEETWEAFKVRRAKSQATPARSRVARYSLSGLVACECGARMVAAKAGNVASWRCSAQQDSGTCPVRGTSARIERLESFVWRWVHENAQGEKLAKAEAERLKAAHKVTTNIENVEKQLASVQRRQARLLDLYLSEGVERAAYDERRQALADELTEAEAALTAAKTEATKHAGPTREVFQSIEALWDKADQHQRRELLSQVVGRVTVNKGHYSRPDKYVITPAWRV